MNDVFTTLNPEADVESDFSEERAREKGYDEATIQAAKSLYDGAVKEREEALKKQAETDSVSFRSDPYSKWEGSQEKAFRKLYNGDPLVREGIEAQIALEKARLAPAKRESVVQYDENANLLPPKRSLRTTRDQVEYFRAIKKAHGVTE